MFNFFLKAKLHCGIQGKIVSRRETSVLVEDRSACDEGAGEVGAAHCYSIGKNHLKNVIRRVSFCAREASIYFNHQVWLVVPIKRAAKVE